MPNASPRPGLLLGLIRARARCSRVVPVSVVPCSPALPISGGDGGPTYLRGGGFLPSRKCLGTSSPPTPLKGYTFTLFHRHPCRHGRPSIRLQTIHVHYRERLVPFPTHDNSSSIKHLGDECWAEPRVLPAGPVVPGPLPSHDGTDVRVDVLPGRHLLGCPARLALLTSSHCPHRLDWGLAVPPTLPAWERASAFPCFRHRRC